MEKITLPYGKKSFTLELAPEEILTVVRANKVDLPAESPAQVVERALANPVASRKLEEIVAPGEKVCILVPDITRLWESTAVSVPIVVAALNRAGVKDEDMFILFATGTHRRMTDAEHEALVGADVAKRLRLVDHQCADEASLRFMGTTSRGTPVLFNKEACGADRIISLCGVVYHFLAGFGGGPKMLLPGISACETISHNHELALNPGGGDNPEVRSGNYSESNPLHADMLEAAGMLPPDFSLNVAVDSKFDIIAAYAGHWQKAHLEACRLVAEMDGVKIAEKAHFVIASAGGSPKDINLYQGVKLLSNAMAAARPGATLILVAEFPEGFGNEDCKAQICNFTNMKSREKALREKFSIGAYSGYLVAEAAERFRVILVTDMQAADFQNTKIRAVKDLDSGLALARNFNGGKLPGKAIIMPHGATTLPMPGKQE